MGEQGRGESSDADDERESNRVRFECDVLVDGEMGILGWSSRSTLWLDMVQDAPDDGGLGDEGENLHLRPATPTGQGVELARGADVESSFRLGDWIVHLSQNLLTRPNLAGGM